MSFQAYLDTIESKTGKKPEDFHKLAASKGLIRPDLKMTEFTNWLKDDFDLGLGHGRALWAVFVQQGWVEAKGSKLKK